LTLSATRRPYAQGGAEDGAGSGHLGGTETGARAARRTRRLDLIVVAGASWRDKEAIMLKRIADVPEAIDALAAVAGGPLPRGTVNSGRPAALVVTSVRVAQVPRCATVVGGAGRV
jgi:hypothetical protein